MTEKGSDWELVKENIQPLRQGRKMSSLRAALAPRAEDQRPRQQQIFENELRTYEGDDPMAIWHKYITWVEQNYPKGGNSGNFQQLISQCVSRFLEDTRYHNDKRYIDVWVKYAGNFTNSLEIYSYMYNRNIGCESAIFYENWAWELQQMGNTKKAFAILQEGLQRKAEPRKILMTAEKALQFKIVQVIQTNDSSEEPTHTEERCALNPLKSIGKKHRAPISRIGDALLQEDVGRLPVQQVPRPQLRQPFQVFNDENGAPSQLPISKGTGKFVSKSERNKENESNPGKWSGVVMKRKYVKLPSHPVENKPAFTVHVDESDSVPTQNPIKLPTNYHILRTRKGHYSPPRILFEPPDARSVPMYNKFKVYGGAEEFQFEEIRAARWLAKMKEQERIEEEKRQRMIEEEVRLLKEELLKLRMQVSSSDNASQVSYNSTSSETANRRSVEEEQRTSPPRDCHAANAAPVQPTMEGRGTGSQSNSYNHSPTRQVQALWNASLFHNSNPKVDATDDRTGLQLPRTVPFQIYEDSNDDPKENVPPKEYVQTNFKRSLAGILQESTNVPMLPLEQQDDSDNSEDEDDLGVCPLPSSQEGTTVVVSAEQFNEGVGQHYASTPFLKTFVPRAADDGFTASLANDVISSVARSEFVTEPKAQANCMTLPENTRMSLGVKNLSPIMEGSREDRYKSSSSSNSSGPYSAMISAYNQTTTHITGKSLHGLQQQTTNNNSKFNRDFIRPRTPERSVGPSTNIDPFCTELQKNLLEKLETPLFKRCGYECKSRNMPRIGPESNVVIGDKTYMVLEKLWKGCDGTLYLAEESDNFQLTLDNLNCGRNLAVLKVNKNGSAWEFYISTELHERLRSHSGSCNVTQSIMLVEHAQIYNDKSILVTSYGKFGTLLDIVNKSKDSMSENLVLYFTLEMLQIVSQVHRCHIVHADIKPDNFVIINLPDRDTLKENEALDKTTCLRLIDFGQSIDMQLFPLGTTFTRTVQTSGFQCTEMQEHKPWTYQTDMYGLLGCIHILLFSKYMEVQRNSNGQWEPTLKFKRYWQKNLWENLFKTLLNIPNCQSIPDLHPFIETIKERLRKSLCWRDLQTQSSQLLCLLRKTRK